MYPLVKIDGQTDIIQTRQTAVLSLGDFSLFCLLCIWHLWLDTVPLLDAGRISEAIIVLSVFQGFLY